MTQSNPRHPVYIVGRQHCGNTMVASLFDKIDGYFSMKEEGNFFEYRDELVGEPFDEQLERLLFLIRKAQLPALGDQIIDELRSSAEARWVNGDDAEAGSVKPLSLYRFLMDRLAELHDQPRWAQKGTSYIFYVEDILEAFDRPALIFMIRNPFDLGASAKRRGKWWTNARMIWGWVQGVLRARRCAREHPEAFRIVRYEDMVLRPEDEVRRLCDFLGVAYDERMLDIGHVNKSETPFNEAEDEEGINDSRLYYYRSNLTAAELEALRLLVPRELVEHFYPDLVSDEPVSWSGYAEAVRLVVGSALQLGSELSRLAVTEPTYAFSRVARRVGMDVD